MLLVLSNGHGEDLMAARLINKIQETAPDIPLGALPIVGEGKVLAKTDAEFIYPGKSFPSGGFVRSGVKYLLADLRAGFWHHWQGQAKALRQRAPQVRLTLAVGDSVLVYLSRRHLRKPLVFIPTAKSDYIQPHFPFEVRWMKESTDLVFPRDSLTAQSLAKQGVNAHFIGNLMMDSIDAHGYDLALGGYGAGKGRPPVIGILPGSRGEAYENFSLLAEAAVAYCQSFGRAAFPVALAGNLDEKRFAGFLTETGWNRKPESAGPEVLASFTKGQALLLLCKGAFGDILHLADIVLGLAGTGNEQAVGLGKPVVTFTGTGSQFTPKFVAAQKHLLGSALAVVYGAEPQDPPPPGLVAEELNRILTNPERREKMAEAGRERMGPPGGVGRVVAQTVELYRRV